MASRQKCVWCVKQKGSFKGRSESGTEGKGKDSRWWGCADLAALGDCGFFSDGKEAIGKFCPQSEHAAHNLRSEFLLYLK